MGVKGGFDSDVTSGRELDWKSVDDALVAARLDEMKDACSVDIAGGESTLEARKEVSDFEFTVVTGLEVKPSKVDKVGIDIGELVVVD